MRFSILGPLEASDGGRPLALGGTRQRALLALLLVNANEAVSSDRLLDELWGEERRDDGSKALQVAVSRLRKALEPGLETGADSGLLVTRPHGYELRVAPGRLDLWRFEELAGNGREALAAGDARVAADMLREALGLWRGAALADLAFEPCLGPEIARLSELRLVALEDRIEADLALAVHARLVPELQELVEREPLRERLRRQLVLALYRSGRQAEALEAYAGARRCLVEELGIEPGRELRELQRAILEQDPALDAPAFPAKAGGDAHVLAAGPSFVGRERELRWLTDALGRALAGRGGVVLLAGEPGIGKSRLADALADAARERGAPVLWGRCWEAGGAPALWPWVQSLRAYVRGCDPTRLRAELGAGAGEIAQLLPELRELLSDLPPSPAAGDEGARFRLFDATAAFLRAAAQATPLVLVLDDLHAADASSLLMLQFLARELGDSRVLMVGAYRDTELVPEHPLPATLAELGRLEGTTRLDLRGFDEDETKRLIELSAGSPAIEEVAAAIYRETEGNPLFVGEVARLLAAEGALDKVSERELWTLVPQGVREVIARRLQRLSDDCKALLAQASALGREFSLPALERISELSGNAILDRLDEAASARVVADVPGVRGRLRFSHALIRDTLYGDLGTARRMRLHQVIGEALEGLYAQDPGPHLAELAHHFLEAGAQGDATKAIDYARRAGGRAGGQLAYEEAARLYRTALEALELETTAAPELRCELLIALNEAYARGGDGSRARDVAREAVEVAKLARLPAQQARAALAYGGRFVWTREASAPGVVEMLEEALVAVGEEDSVLRVQLLSRLATALRSDPSRARRTAIGDEAVAMAQRIGDRDAYAYALDARWVAAHGPDNLVEHVVVANELLELGREAADAERLFAAHEHLAFRALEVANATTVAEELHELTRLAEELRQPGHAWMVTSLQALLSLWRGEFSEAAQLIDQAAEMGARAQSWNAAVTRRLQEFVLCFERGRLAEVAQEIISAPHEFPSPLTYRCVVARVHAELDHPGEADKQLEALFKENLADFHLDEEWLFCMSLLPEVCAVLGDRDGAERLYALMLPYSDRYAVATPEAVFGAVARPLGVAATVALRFDEAERHFEEALEIEAHTGARPWLAHTRHDFARMLATRRGRGDEERARALQAAAIDGYRELGMDAWAERASTQAVVP